MILDALHQRTKTATKLFALAAQATFLPRRTGLAIELGDKADFNLRLAFFLAMGALIMALHGLVAGYLGLKQMPGRLDVFWEYLQPWLAGLLLLTFYLPLRLLGFTRAKFSEYFQVAATNMGPGLLYQLCSAISVIVTFHHYGTPNADSDLVRSLLKRPEIINLEQCLPKFDSYYCLNLLSQYAPNAQWTNYLQLAAFGLWCWAGMRLFHAGLGIAYWKQFIAFWIMIALLAAGLFAIGIF